MIKAYASYFVSYLLNETKDISNIRMIILFGSVATGNANKESDVDIFIDVRKKSKNFDNQIDKAVNNFYKSREGLLFKSRGIDNKINVIAGRIDEWAELKKSIESTGIVLYGAYPSNKSSGKKSALIHWDKINKNRGAFLNKIYGVKINNKKYKGLIEEYGGERIGKSCIVIPIEYREEIIKLLKKYGVNARIKDVYI
jgi:hypothetical protein